MTNPVPLDDFEVFDLYPDVLVDHDNIEHYRALAAGRLVINRCDDCGYWVYPHRPLCPECQSWNLTPTEVSGRGKVFLFTLVHQVRDPANPIHEPIPVAAVELAEQPGLRYLSRIVNCRLDRIVHDMPVTLTWVDIGKRRWPAFEPARAEGEAPRG